MQGSCAGLLTNEGYILTYTDANCTKPDPVINRLPLDRTCVPSANGSFSDIGCTCAFGIGMR